MEERTMLLENGVIITNFHEKKLTLIKFLMKIG